jgi:CHAT domain
VADHLSALGRAFAHAAPALGLREADDRDDLRTLIEADLPILYFLCHGIRRRGVTLLGVGKRDEVSPDDVIGWVDVAARRGRRMWTDPRPFVFVNACASLAIAPDDLLDYLNAFVGKARAVGVMGTEAQVEATQAMELAEAFFDRLLQPGATVDDALHHVRQAFLADGNLLGLTYTPYCFADLRVEVEALDGDRTTGGDHPWFDPA